MTWLFQLHATHPVAHAVGVLAPVCVGGMALGSVRVRGIGLGTAFATNLAHSDAPTIAYATVYPLTMLLRILVAQVLALVLLR